MGADLGVGADLGAVGDLGLGADFRANLATFCKASLAAALGKPGTKRSP